jgi:Flp pilus assembly protein TadD
MTPVPSIPGHPNDPMSRVNLANALREIGDLDQARAHYEAALNIDPDHAEAHQGLAAALEECGDLAGATRHRRIGCGSRRRRLSCPVSF